MPQHGCLCRDYWDVRDVLLPLARRPEVRELWPWTVKKVHEKGDSGLAQSKKDAKN